jgi:sRNA-binding protein
MWLYTGRRKYLNQLLLDADRVDLDGVASGKVNEDDVNYAKQKIIDSLKRYKKTKVKPAEPVKEKPPEIKVSPTTGRTILTLRGSRRKPAEFPVYPLPLSLTLI